MDDQTLLVVDDDNNFLGYAPRSVCHSGLGRRHRAFVTLLFDSSNRVLLQKRKHKLFDGLWDLTAISHPLRLNGKDETYQEASDRALKKEMGTGHVSIEEIGAFNYFAKDGKNCENEYCAVLVGKYDGNFVANPEEIYETKKISYREFVADVLANRPNYTPWAIESVAILEKHNSG